MKKLLTIFLIAIFAFTNYSFANGIQQEPQKTPRLGVWITVFSPSEILKSKETVDKLIGMSKKCGIDDIYMQVYRADKAYYDSDITEKKVVSATGEDLFPYLIKRAKSSEIKIHAWLNVFSIARNEEANIIKKFGKSVLTLDQYGRPSMKVKAKSNLDKYYIREHQLFLEPGDMRVRNYMASIAAEVVTKYPGLDGLHLDYIRYPSVVPFIPGSRFTSHGISYGYTERNMENFKDSTGLNPKTMDYDRDNFYKWDQWRRDKVTELVENISERARNISPDIEISCTIVASIERTYMTTLQDWTEWLDKGYANYIVVMNYTDDTKLMKMNSEAIMLPEYDGKIQIGLGAYLLEKKPNILKSQIKELNALSPPGIVIFSYDDIVKSEEFQNYLAGIFNKDQVRQLSSNGS